MNKKDTCLNAFTEIARAVASCKVGCEGIMCDAAHGYVPRCLFLEEEGRAEGTGVIVIGLNPGSASPDEVAFYASSTDKHAAVQDFFWRERATTNKYYARLRSFIDSIGLRGTIWWTELAKCENLPGTKGLPLETLRRCAGLFLQRELKVVPTSWPIIAVGREAHRAVSYLLPDRPVIGVPHPTGAQGKLIWLYTRPLPPQVLALVSRALDEKSAPWLAAVLRDAKDGTEVERIKRA